VTQKALRRGSVEGTGWSALRAIAARHSDPRTTSGYDRNRHNLDRHAVHTLAAYVSGAA
jgi:hypothetical protein